MKSSGDGNSCYQINILKRNFHITVFPTMKELQDTIQTNLHKSLFVARQKSPITSIHTEVILSSWLEFEARLLLFGLKEMIWFLCFGQVSRR